MDALAARPVDGFEVVLVERAGKLGHEWKASPRARGAARALEGQPEQARRDARHLRTRDHHTQQRRGARRSSRALASVMVDSQLADVVRRGAVGSRSA